MRDYRKPKTSVQGPVASGQHSTDRPCCRRCAKLEHLIETLIQKLEEHERHASEAADRHNARVMSRYA